MEGADQAPRGQLAVCRHPALGAQDSDRAPRLKDAYVTWRNPFVYFHTLIDKAAKSPCATNDVPLTRLTADLKSKGKTAALSYIVPSPCDDGDALPCAPKAASGLAAADKFLQKVVPEIERSPAYKADGLIAVTFDQAPQTGPNADPSACCDAQTFPNLPRTTSTTTPTGTTTPGSTPSGSNPTATTPAGEHPDHGSDDDADNHDADSTLPPTTTTPATGGGQTTPTGGGGSGRAIAHLELRQARERRRRRLLQPLLAAGHDREHLRARTPRLRRRPLAARHGRGGFQRAPSVVAWRSR